MNRSVGNRSQRQWEAEVRHRVRHGDSPQAVIDYLVTEGFTLYEANELVEKAAAEHRNSALKMLVIGLGIAAIGLVVTIASYSAAASSPAGGEYFIWFGPVIAGVCLAIAGMVRLSR